MATPFAPKSRDRSAVAREAERILATLLPSRIAPISFSPSSVTFSARSAPPLPLSACARSLPRDAAVSAVSEPEKKADSSKRHRIAAVVIQKVESSISSQDMAENPLGFVRYGVRWPWSQVSRRHAPAGDASEQGPSAVHQGHGYRSRSWRCRHGPAWSGSRADRRRRREGGWQRHGAGHAA